MINIDKRNQIITFENLETSLAHSRSCKLFNPTIQITVIFNNIEDIFEKIITDKKLLKFNFLLAIKFVIKVTNSVSIITTVIPTITCIEVKKTITNELVNRGNFFGLYQIVQSRQSF